MKRTRLALGVFLSVSPIVLASTPGSFDRTLPVTGEVDLEVISNPGGMTITAGTASSVRVHAVIRPLYGEVDFGLADANIRALELKPPIEQSGNRVRIGYVGNPEILRGVSIHFDIETPRQTRVRAHTTSGGIRIDGIAGPAFADASSGRIEISNFAAEVEVRNSSGAVVIRSLGRPRSCPEQFWWHPGFRRARPGRCRDDIGTNGGQRRSRRRSFQDAFRQHQHRQRDRVRRCEQSFRQHRRVPTRRPRAG